MSVKRDWEAILEAEGLGARLREIKPRPRIDRDWGTHFSSRRDAFRDAVDRLRLDAQSATDLFSMLADIRWGRHCASIEPLTDTEREVFDPYCDGLSFERIGALLGISDDTARNRFNKALSRFTDAKPHLSRNLISGNKHRLEASEDE